MSSKVIYIDHRENIGDLLTELTKAYLFRVEKKVLQHGDYFIEPDITIERKTTRDFCVSIMDGRLFKQAYVLAEYTDNPVFIVEGDSFKNHNVSIPAIKGALISLAQTFRMPVLRTRNQKDTAWHINQMSEQRNRSKKDSGPLHTYRPKKLNSQKEYVLRALPGVGIKYSKLLLDRFGSVSNVAKATKEDLEKTPGLGKKTAKRIHDVLKEPPAHYGPTNTKSSNT